MPEFVNPFSQNVPDRKLTIEELIRAIRLDMAAELEAASLYEAHAQAIDHPIARKVLLDVANEEREHAGEFLELLNILTDYQEAAWMANGVEEVKEMAAEVARGDIEPASPAEKQAEEEGEEGSAEIPGDILPTIGSMKQ